MTKNGSFEFYENYSDSVKKIQPEVYCEIEKILNSEFRSFYSNNNRKPVVLDIGSAGVFPYDVNLAEKIFVLDLFAKPEYLHLNGPIEWICGDILSDSIVSELTKTSRYDYIVMSSLLHHLCDKNNNSGKNLKSCFSHSQLLLSDTGKIAIFESTCSDTVSKLEDLLYPFYTWILLRILKFTYVRMQSDDEIVKALSDAGLHAERVHFEQPRYIAQISFRIPIILCPLKVSAFFAFKKK